MDRKTLAAVIAELTGALRPANGSTETELERGRALLAQGLHSGQTADEFRGAASIGVNPAADKQAQQFLYLFGKKPATSKRVFARTVPSATNFHRSTPEWARGIAIADSTGPFLTPLGNPIWIDAFDVIQNTSLTRDSATLIGLFRSIPPCRPVGISSSARVACGCRASYWTGRARMILTRDSASRAVP